MIVFLNFRFDVRNIQIVFVICSFVKEVATPQLDANAYRFPKLLLPISSFHLLVQVLYSIPEAPLVIITSV